jgi:hypothetical protein
MTSTGKSRSDSAYKTSGAQRASSGASGSAIEALRSTAEQ